MPCRTRQRPAAPSSVSLGWDSTLPLWSLTRLRSTPSPPSPAHPGTSGPQTGESKDRKPSYLNINSRKNLLDVTTTKRDPQTFSVIVFLSSGVFEIAEASGVQQGTKIVLHLKDDCKEFSSEDRVKGLELLQWLQL